MQLGFSLFISEDGSYTARFMYPPQKRNHRLRRHRVAIFGSHNNFTFVLGAAEEEAEGALDLFLGGEFFYHFVESLIMVESEDKDSCEFGFGVVQGVCLFALLKRRVTSIKELNWGKTVLLKRIAFCGLYSV